MILRQIAGAAIAGMVATATSAVAETVPEAVDPFALYGSEIRFDVYRKGERVGTHRTTFERLEDGLLVTTHFDVEIGFLGFTAYTFDYTSEALWRDHELRRIDIRVDEDGDVRTIQGSATDDGFRVTGPEGVARTPLGIIPTNHWNMRQVAQDKLLNTLTGTVEAVDITTGDAENVSTGTGPRAARHYRYSSGFEAESWYDAEGRWVKLRFAGTDGSTIEYVCQKCGLAPDLAQKDRE